MKIEKNIQVSVVMGSQSDWEIMQVACDLLEKLDVSYEKKIVSAHRTPDRLYAVSYTHLTLPTKA